MGDRLYFQMKGQIKITEIRIIKTIQMKIEKMNQLKKNRTKIILIICLIK